MLKSRYLNVSSTADRKLNKRERGFTERVRSSEWTILAAQISSRSMVMLLNLRNAVQSAKSILPDVKNKVLIGIRITNLQYFSTDYITEIDEFQHHFC